MNTTKFVKEILFLSMTLFSTWSVAGTNPRVGGSTVMTEINQLSQKLANSRSGEIRLAGKQTSGRDCLVAVSISNRATILSIFDGTSTNLLGQLRVAPEIANIEAIYGEAKAIMEYEFPEDQGYRGGRLHIANATQNDFYVSEVQLSMESLTNPYNSKLFGSTWTLKSAEKTVNCHTDSKDNNP